MNNKKIYLSLLILCVISTLTMFTGYAVLTDTLSVTGNVTALSQHRIEWKNYNGNIIELDVNKVYGTNNSYDSGTPTRSDQMFYYYLNNELVSNVKATYTFKGWTSTTSATPSITTTYKVESDETYTANYTEALNYTASLTVNRYLYVGKDDNYGDLGLSDSAKAKMTDDGFINADDVAADGITISLGAAASVKLKYSYNGSNKSKSSSDLTSKFTGLPIGFVYEMTPKNITTTVNSANVTWYANQAFVDGVFTGDDVINIYYFRNQKSETTATDFTDESVGNSADNPYIINSQKDYIAFRDAVNDGNDFAGKFIKVTRIINISSLKTAQEQIIGNSWSLPFNGTFNGNYARIKGLQFVGTDITEFKNYYPYKGSNGNWWITMSTGDVDTGYSTDLAADLEKKTGDDKIYLYIGTNKIYKPDNTSVGITNTDIHKTLDTGYRYTGLFSMIGASGVVKDLIVDDDGGSAISSSYAQKDINGSEGSIGAIAGHCSGQILNCASYVDVSNPICSFAGGIVGYVGESATIDGCSYYGTLDRTGSDTVSAASDAGGVTGVNLGTIKNCFNAGTVKGVSSIGGIAGNSYHQSTLIQNCLNLGTVSGIKSNDVGWNVGGIVGSSSCKLIEYCINYGSVEGADGTGAYGGIVGADTGRIFTTDPTVITGEIRSCINNGTVSSNNRVGGIAGTSKSPITECINSGQVTALKYEGGGIVGLMELDDKKIADGVVITNSKITNSINYGNVTVGWTGGGIAGRSWFDIIGCKNYGQVTGNSTHIGGIIGTAGNNASGVYDTINISNCENYGCIKGSWGVGGIAGSNYSGQIANCKNGVTTNKMEYSATINGTGQVGGITGKQGAYTSNPTIVSHEATVTGCTNEGYIMSTGSSSGGITGSLCLFKNSTASSVLYDNTNSGYVVSGKQTYYEILRSTQ